MHHWNCTLMALNPDRLVNRTVEIVQTRFDENRTNAGPLLVITVERTDVPLRASLHLMTGYDPDGEPTERLKEGELPRSILNFYKDFGVESADQLVRLAPKRIRLNGLYWEDSNDLMGLCPLICLGRFPTHSWSAWGNDPADGLYKHECTLAGCPEKEAFKELQFSGTMKCVDAAGNTVEYQSGCATHAWGIWKSTAGREGTYLPPFAYKTTCTACGMTWFVERLYKKYDPKEE